MRRLHTEDSEDLFRALTAYQDGRAVEEDVRRWRAGVPGRRAHLGGGADAGPVIVANARQDTRMIKAAVRRWDIRSIMAVPMVFDDEVMGLLLDGRRRPLARVQRPRSRGAGKFAELAAATFSRARQRLALRAELEASRRHLVAERRAAAPRALSGLVGRGRPLEEVLGALAETSPALRDLPQRRRHGAVGLPPGGAETASSPPRSVRSSRRAAPSRRSRRGR